MLKKTLLTIAIPTYNRSLHLDESLKRIAPQIIGLEDMVELIVSDNCSTDDTQEIVKRHISQGLKIVYFRNSTNLGMDGNFVQCFRKAKAEYVWVLGDDDYLLPSKVMYILELLQTGDYGLVHLKITKDTASGIYVHNDYKKFYSEISFWITYISSNIVRTQYVAEVPFEKYMGSYFTLIPLYLNALSKHEKNLMIHDKIFEHGAAVETNGGYNFFKIFITNYLSILREYRNLGVIPFWRYKLEKYKLCRYYLFPSIYKLYFLRKGNHNYDTKGALKILFRNYWYEPYFYLACLALGIKISVNTFH